HRSRRLVLLAVLGRRYRWPNARLWRGKRRRATPASRPLDPGWTDLADGIGHLLLAAPTRGCDDGIARRRVVGARTHRPRLWPSHPYRCRSGAVAAAGRLGVPRISARAQLAPRALVRPRHRRRAHDEIHGRVALPCLPRTAGDALAHVPPCCPAGCRV